MHVPIYSTYVSVCIAEIGKKMYLYNAREHNIIYQDTTQHFTKNSKK